MTLHRSLCYGKWQRVKEDDGETFSGRCCVLSLFYAWEQRQWRILSLSQWLVVGLTATYLLPCRLKSLVVEVGDYTRSLFDFEKRNDPRDETMSNREDEYDYLFKGESPSVFLLVSYILSPSSHLSATVIRCQVAWSVEPVCLTSRHFIRSTGKQRHLPRTWAPTLGVVREDVRWSCSAIWLQH